MSSARHGRGRSGLCSTFLPYQPVLPVQPVLPIPPVQPIPPVLGALREVSPLRFDVDGIERLARGHEQAIAT
jgi:hypothetical protein